MLFEEVIVVKMRNIINTYIRNAELLIIKEGGTYFQSFIYSQAHVVQDGPLASLSGFLDHPHRDTVGLLWTSDQPVAETSTYTGQHNIQTQQTYTPRANSNPRSQQPSGRRPTP
jgi:hypothetical protein